MVKSIWQDVAIEPELREFIALSPADVHYLNTEAMKSPMPATRLAMLLNDRGRAKRDARLAHFAERKKEDAAKIGDTDSWPSVVLRLKTQPWVTEKEGRMRFAFISYSDPLLVTPDHDVMIRYDSVEELVETWSVD